MNRLGRALALVIMLMCSACQFFDPTVREYETLFKSQKMIISPYSSGYASSHGPGFGVMMKPDEARKINAPDSIEFREMLTKQLSVERQQGNNFCPDGYFIDRVIYFTHWYTEIWINCKNNGGNPTDSRSTKQ